MAEGPYACIETTPADIASWDSSDEWLAMEARQLEEPRQTIIAMVMAVCLQPTDPGSAQVLRRPIGQIKTETGIDDLPRSRETAPVAAEEASPLGDGRIVIAFLAVQRDRRLPVMRLSESAEPLRVLA